MFARPLKIVHVTLLVLLLAGLLGAQPVAAQSAPVLGITKTADKAVINGGEPMGFTITVTNSGTAAATAVKVTDTLPGSSTLTWRVSPAVTGCTISRRVLTCTFNDLPAGQSRAVHVVSGNVPSACAVYASTVTVTSTNHATLTASASVQALCADVVVTAAPVNSPIFAGEVAAFAVTVQNTGSGAAKSVRLVNTLPSVVTWRATGASCTRLFVSDFICNLGTLAPGASVTVTFSATIPTYGCGSLQNDAFVSASNEPSGTGGNSAVAVLDIHCPDLQVTNTADAQTVEAGAPVGLTLGALNAGVATAYTVTLSAVLPSAPGLAWAVDPAVEGCAISGGTLTCTRSTLAGGAGFTVHLTSPTTAESCGTYTTTAQLKDQFDQPVTADAAITVTCPVAPPPAE